MGTDSPQTLLSAVFFYNGLNLEAVNLVSRQLAIHDSILILILGLVPVLICMLPCTI